MGNFMLCSLPIVWSELLVHSCSTLCDLLNCSLQGSSIHGIFQARILEWVAISFSRGSFQPRDWTQVCCTTGRFFTYWAMREAPLLFDLRRNCGRGDEDNGTPSKGPMHALLHSVPMTLQQATANPCLHLRLLDLTGKSGSLSCGVTAPFSWVLVCTRFCLCPPRVCFPSPV